MFRKNLSAPMGFHTLRKLKCETQLLLLFSLLTSYFPFTKFPYQQLPPEHLISSLSKCDESKTKAQVEYPTPPIGVQGTHVVSEVNSLAARHNQSIIALFGNNFNNGLMPLLVVLCCSPLPSVCS